MSGPDAAAGRYFIWGSFDGTSNAPIVYPNGTSIANLDAQNLIRISPTTLPNGTSNILYSATLSATGSLKKPCTWSLAPGSAGLPPGLTLTNKVNGDNVTGVISGIPTERGTFDDIVVRMTDTSSYNKPSYSVDTIYSITIH